MPNDVRGVRLGLPYAALWLVMNVWLHNGVDTLFVPVLAYSAVLVTMAARALDVSRRLAPPYSRRLAWDVVVMTTHVAAQVLIAAGLTLGLQSAPQTP